MKSRSILLLASAGLALAHPEALHHKRFHELKARQADQPATETTVISTVSVYELNGKVISYEELQEGLKNGTLVLDGDAPAPSSAAQAQPAVASPPVVVEAASASSPEPSTTTTQAATSAASPAPASASPSKAPVQNKAVQQPSSSSSGSPSSYGGNASSGGSSSYGSGSGNGLDRDYDNSVSCSDFPSDFGAIPVDYLGNNGWLDIMTPGSGSSSAGLNNLITGKSCTEGAYCSYACPAGYEKTQWPETQGATGQSVGGLLCKNGKLTLTRSEVPQLCSTTTNVQVTIQNKLSQQVAVCRTDYPGTENMNIPLSLAGGATSEIACPNQATAYKWQGKSTSAQYYVNPAGVSVEEGCVWGSSAQPYGNWAPLNLGVSYTDGLGWLSIIPNFPTQKSVTLDFKVSIVGDNSAQCVYQNGKYNGVEGAGCTVSIPNGGKAAFVFEDA